MVPLPMMVCPDFKILHGIYSLHVNLGSNGFQKVVETMLQERPRFQIARIYRRSPTNVAHANGMTTQPRSMPARWRAVVKKLHLHLKVLA